jgi:hypothetical protein
MERIEQHIGTIMQIMVIGLLGWSLKTNVDTRTEIGILQAKVEAMQHTISQGTSDRYRGSDAARDNAAIWAELQRQNSRITQIEDRRR